MSVDIEDLMRSLTTYIQVSQDERIARDKYDGYSWGYHGSSLLAECHEAAKVFEGRLNDYIDGRIKSALGQAK